MSELVDVFLYGPLADQFGPRHRFAIRSPREAVAALHANCPGFRQAFIQSDIYYIQADGDWRDGDDAATMPVSRELHLVPQIEGRAFLGALAITALFPAIGTTAATLLGGLLVTGLLIGLSFLLQPKIKKKEEDKKTESYAFSGPENVTQQGAPVPLVYGRLHCGSVVVSAGLEVNLIQGDPNHQGPTNYSGPDNLQSKQLARIIDVVSEGSIAGLPDGLKGIFLDGVPLQNADNSLNFQNVDVQIVYGHLNQPIMTGFAAQQVETAVGVEMKYNVHVIRTITNPEVDRCRVTVSVPTLLWTTEGGDIKGFAVNYAIGVVGAGGGGHHIGSWVISGKTQSRYQRQVVFKLPKGEHPWDIHVYRTSADENKAEIQDDIYFDSYTEIVDDRINYNLTAAIGLQIDAENFQTIPQRAYLIDGLLIKVPVNYDQASGTYAGVWNGTFKFAWANNPAFIFYDLVSHNRYGLGRFIPADWIDKWAIYAIGKWCDQLVPDGRGGHERRFVCNVQITSQQEAFDLLAEMASIFRGFCYWAGGQLVPVADMPADPADQFTNADIIDGHFNYASGDIRARHTMAAVAWNDPALLGQTRIAIVEDQEAISRYGIQQLDLVATGAVTESQAIRTGKWALFTELYEGETISFSTGLKGAYLLPGDIIRVMDVTIAGKRRGGRTGAGSTAATVVFDAPLGTPFASGAGGVYLSCMIGEGLVETRQVEVVTPDYLTATLVEPFSAAPAPDTVFIINHANALEPTLWRVTQARQAESGVYEVNGVRHYPDKWAYVERDIALTEPDVSDIQSKPKAVTNLTIREFLVATSPISVGVRVALSWTSTTAASFDVYWRPQNGNWSYMRTDQHAVELAVTEGTWEFRVVPVSSLGIKGPATTKIYKVIGRFAPPAVPRRLRINVLDSVAHFDWLPATEIDVIIGGHFELRHSSRTSGASWNTAQRVIASIPGSATSVETGYQVGTWFLRTFDIVGVPSATSAAVIALAPDIRYQQYVRVCENTDWLGSRYNTEVLDPQRWLVIGTTGGLWDEQPDDVDDWTDVNTLPVPVGGTVPPPEGSYDFYNRIDAGAPFTVRLSADILAFPFAEPDDFLDSRLTDSDDWVNWDDAGEDLTGEVTVLVRSTLDDPTSPAAIWTDWSAFATGEHYARAWEFKAMLSAPPGQNIGVENLCILADLRNKIDEGADVPYPAARTRVTYRIKFYSIPAVVLTVQEAQATDQIQIVEKTRDYFDIEIKTPPSTHVTRTFDWHAQGF